MYGRPGVASARCALHDSMLPLLRSSQSHPVLLTHEGFQTWPPPGPVSQGALCTPRVLANAVNKAMFSVPDGVRLRSIKWDRGSGRPVGSVKQFPGCPKGPAATARRILMVMAHSECSVHTRGRAQSPVSFAPHCGPLGIRWTRDISKATPLVSLVSQDGWALATP